MLESGSWSKCLESAVWLALVRVDDRALRNGGRLRLSRSGFKAWALLEKKRERYGWRL